MSEWNKKEYIEEFTKCDACELLQSCIKSGKVIEITHRRDSLRHYSNTIGYECNMNEYMTWNFDTCRHNKDENCSC